MSFTPKWYPGGWVEWAPDKFAACGLLDQSACLAMAEEIAADPSLAPEDDGAGALQVEITKGHFIWGKYVFLAGVSLAALAIATRG
ncbi:MAG: hypothetical protein ACFB13_21190 [Kiloniellaceae bacterium]